MNDIEVFRSYCDSITSNTTIKTAYIIDEDFEKRLSSVCGVSPLYPSIYVSVIQPPSAMYGVHVMKNNILYHLIAEVLEKLFTAGILQYSWKLEQEMAFPINPPEPEDSRRVLSLNDLAYGFYGFLIALGISSFVFLIEVLSFWLPRARDKIKEFFRSLLVIYCVIMWLNDYLSFYHI